MILTLKTNEKDATVSLCDVDGNQIASQTWEALRVLSDTLLKTIEELLNSQNSTFDDISGIVVFSGPGSFTGLRIGITVANTLANGLSIPIVGVGEGDWLKQGIKRLAHSESDVIVAPVYGGEANITQPRK